MVNSNDDFADFSLHCRSRKAKCDLGDIDAPSSPPCTRCRRESRECVFAPSRRGGNNARRPKDEPQDQPYYSSSIQNLLQSPLYPESADTPSPKRRRLDPPHQDDPSSIVIADMQNESDALNILAVASARKSPEASKAGSSRRDALSEFALIKSGIVDEEQTSRLAETFFRFHHHLFVSCIFSEDWLICSPWYLRPSFHGHRRSLLCLPKMNATSLQQ